MFMCCKSKSLLLETLTPQLLEREGSLDSSSDSPFDEKRDFRDEGCVDLVLDRDTFLFVGLLSGVETVVGSCRFIRAGELPVSTDDSKFVALLISSKSLHKFLIFRAQELHTRLDKEDNFTK